MICPICKRTSTFIEVSAVVTIVVYKVDQRIDDIPAIECQECGAELFTRESLNYLEKKRLELENNRFIG